MAETNDWNAKIIAEFRANDGKVGGPFEGAPMIIVHHTGRKSGEARETPMVYQPGDDGVVYVFASKAGAPTHPDWYYNLTGGGPTKAEIGTDTYDVTVSELPEPARSEIYAKQVSAMAGFAEYEEKTKGIRTIPVLALTKA